MIFLWLFLSFVKATCYQCDNKICAMRLDYQCGKRKFLCEPDGHSGIENMIFFQEGLSCARKSNFFITMNCRRCKGNPILCDT